MTIEPSKIPATDARIKELEAELATMRRHDVFYCASCGLHFGTDKAAADKHSAECPEHPFFQQLTTLRTAAKAVCTWNDDNLRTLIALLKNLRLTLGVDAPPKSKADSTEAAARVPSPLHADPGQVAVHVFTGRHGRKRF